MKPPLEDDLKLRKLMLQQRSAVLRQMLAIQARQVISPAVHVADKAKSGGRWVRQNPLLIAGAAALLMAWRPNALLGGVARTLGLWQTGRRLLPLALRLWDRWLHRSRA